MRITIIGAYGYGNLGDELMLDGVLAGIGRTMPGAEITVISGDPEETARSHEVHAIKRGGGTIARLQRYWEMVQSDLLVIGGGNLRDNLPEGRHSSRPNALSMALGPVLLAHEIGVPTMCYAISIGHVVTPQGRSALKDCLVSVDAVTVRDPSSAARISELGVSREITVAADAAFSVMPESRHSEHRSGIVLALRHWFEKGNFVENPEEFHRMLREIATYCDAFIEQYHEPVWLVPFKATEADGDNDVAIHRELAAMMDHEDEVKLMNRVPDLGGLSDLFASARLVLGMRLHSVIIATATGTPWVSIDYDPKVRSFACYAGHERFCLEVEDISSGRLLELHGAALAEWEAISDRLLDVSERFRSLERNNAEVARNVLRIRPPRSAFRKMVVRTIRLLGYRLRKRATKETI